ncbi:Multimeric flavodoxin WrbA [Butyrivibrio sp. YAB3001]|nr:Multimeric flavodoxin WrbA [Butyrivibrio sp. YAB3001]
MDEFKRGAEESGHKVEVLDVCHMNINPCIGCIQCGYEGPCVQKDDTVIVKDKLLSSDVLVFATPTYFSTMNGMLKNLIDRFLPKWQDLGKHDVYFIITGHDGKRGLELVEKELITVFENLGNTVMGTIWGEGVWQKGEVMNTKAMLEAYKAGKNI